MDYVLRERGRHFDPEVVDAFLDAESEFDEVRLTLGDQAPGADPSLLQPAPRVDASSSRLPFGDLDKSTRLN